MRFSITSEFSLLERTWREAYAEHDKFAQAGDDGVGRGGTQAATRASEREIEALNTLLHAPAFTPMEVRQKLKIMDERYEEVGRADLELELGQIQRDMLTFFRQNASPSMTVSFDDYAAAHRHFWERGDLPDHELQRRGEEVQAKLQAVLSVPCTTPGDFIVKRCLQLIQDYGSCTSPAPMPFLPDIDQASDRFDQAAYRDALDCDLGRCLTILGKLEFDAAEWVQQAKRHGKSVRVVRGRDGSRSLSFGMDGAEPVATLLQILIAGGLEDISKERCQAVADEIEARHPDLVWDIREAVAA